jgi:Calx-beta domain-containing protein/concanavalin A-like lectin/glucanase superfamily protein
VPKKNERRSAHCAALLLALAMLVPLGAADAGSIRFFGNGANDIDRIKIRVDPPGPPADIGAGNFTIEFWIKGSAADNSNTVRCGSGVYGWIDGNIILDRDRFNLPRSFGLSLGSGRVAFGANVDNMALATLCGSRGVLDGQWHHVAVTRSGSEIRLFVDGVADGSINGIGGDLSYPNNAQPQPGNCGSPNGCPNDPFLVVGAEKHDAFPASRLAFNGLIDELRLSNNARYTGSFSVPTTPFTSDANTAALYHFDEATTGSCTSGTVIGDSATGGASPGVCFFGGSPGGPVWSADSPFAPAPGGPGSLQFSSATAAAAEGTATATISVTRTGGSTGAVSVNYASADGSASANADYTPVNGQLNWADGDAAPKPINITILDDSMTESSENFTVTLSAPGGGATLGAPNTATINIADNDSPGRLQLSAATYAAAEGTAIRTVSVTRTNGSIGAVTVNCATSDGTAVAPGDYTSKVATLQWTSGDSTPQPCDVTIIDDQVVDTGESFSVALSAPSGGATLGTPATATVTITDNDGGGGGGGTTSSGGGGGTIDWLLVVVGLTCTLLKMRRGDNVYTLSRQRAVRDS